VPPRQPSPPSSPPSPPSSPPPGPDVDDGAPVTPEDAERLRQLTRELVEAPAADIVANHAMGLFELAALHLSQPEPRMAEVQLAIDAMGLIVEGLAGRLGEAEPTLKDAIAQLRLAFVQIRASGPGGPASAAPG
jgi:hypothetical protein